MQQEEFESPTSRFVAECSIQLSYCCIYRKYYKIHLQHFHLKYIFKGNFRGKLTRKSLKPFNTNNFEIECVRFVAWYSIQLNYRRIFVFYLLKLKPHISLFIFSLILVHFILYFDFSFYSSLFLIFFIFFSKSIVKLFFLWYII